jgi:hypothetical protein
MFVDVFHGPTNEMFPRTRSLTRIDEFMRTITCLVAFLSALEVTYGGDFGRAELVAALRALGPFDIMTTIARRNGLRNLLGSG